MRPLHFFIASGLALVAAAAIAEDPRDKTVTAQIRSLEAYLAKIEPDCPGGLVRLTPDDYDVLYGFATMHAELDGIRPAGKEAMARIEDWRIREYPSLWGPEKKHSLYLRELRVLEAERDRRTRNETRRILAKMKRKAAERERADLRDEL
jgi:hypothetical protein